MDVEAVDRHVLVTLLRDRPSGAQQLGPFGNRDELDAVNAARLARVVHEQHLLDIAAALCEAEPLRERDGSHVVTRNVRAGAHQPLPDGVLGEAREQQAADAVSALVGKHARREKRIADDVRAVVQPARGELAVEVRKQVQVAGLDVSVQLREGRRPVLGMHSAPDVEPQLVVRVRLACAQPDHPDLFNFPCFFA